MAQWDKLTQRYLNNNNTLHETSISVDQYGYPAGSHGMGAATSYTAFGENAVAETTPVIQLEGIYGLDPREIETYSASGGGYSATDSLMQVSTGTSIGGYGVVRSRRVVRYRPGQGAVARFTAQFTATDEIGVAGYTQRAGFFNQENAVQVGFDGEKFGVLRQSGGKAHIHQFTITAGASASGNITLTLNNISTVVAVTSGDTIAQVVHKIAAAFVANVYWITEETNTQVYFLSRNVGIAFGAGTFSFAAAATGVTATNSSVQEGVDHTNNWTYQVDFNLDRLDGNGPSGMLLDPSKLNVFQISFRWLGAGQIQYAIENSINGDMIFFHHEHYSNRYDVPHLNNPTMKIGYVAASLGGTGTNVVVSGASMMGGIEGKIATTQYSAARSRIRTGLGTSTTEYQHIFSIKNRMIADTTLNLREVSLKSINATLTANTGNAAFTAFLFLNATNSVDHVWTPVSSTNPVLFSTVDGILSSITDVPLYALQVSQASPVNADLDNLRIILPPNSSLSVYVRMAYGSGSLNGGAGLNWIED